jgi:RNA polymerase sigma-70 factor (ECF subfamily)
MGEIYALHGLAGAILPASRSKAQTRRPALYNPGREHGRHPDTNLTAETRLEWRLATANCIQNDSPGAYLATQQELAAFLEEVERRAFKQAMFAVRDHHVALDIVQDAMLKLSDRYAGRPAPELPLLFQRILQNTIRDFYRRQKVRSLWTTLFSSFQPKDADEDFDPLETMETDGPGGKGDSPADRMERSQIATLIGEGLEKLPARQREAFLLRYWEELDVAETAAAMGCSEGSVKTHCSRATHALAAFLKEKGIEP